MRRCLTAILVVGLVSLTARDAAAQPSAKDIVAYTALVLTPVGSHSPILISPGMKGEKNFSSFAMRFSHFAPSTGDGTNNLGASYYMPAGSNAAIGGTLGYIMPSCDGCDGVFNAGADVNSTLWNSSSGTSINMQGSFGYAKESDLTALSLAVGFPLALSMTQASKARVTGFITPGFGWGRLSASGTSESGTRPLVGAGAAWESPGGWGVHAAFQKIIIEDGGNNFGLGFSYKMR